MAIRIRLSEVVDSSFSNILLSPNILSLDLVFGGILRDTTGTMGYVAMEWSRAGLGPGRIRNR